MRGTQCIECNKGEGNESAQLWQGCLPMFSSSRHGGEKVVMWCVAVIIYLLQTDITLHKLSDGTRNGGWVGAWVSPGLFLRVYRRTLNPAARHVATQLQAGQSKTFCMLLQRIMGRISSNKNADIYTDSFLLDPDSSEGMKGWGKVKINLIVFNCKKVVRW